MKRELDAVSGTLANMIKTQADDNKFTSIDGGTMVTDKVIVMITMTIITFSFGIMPLKLYSKVKSNDHSNTSKIRWRNLISFSSCFGGGVFIAACLLDLLPDVEEKMGQVLAELKNKYNVEYFADFPISQFLMVVGFLLILTIEQGVLHFQELWKMDEERQPLLNTDIQASAESYNTSQSHQHNPPSSHNHDHHQISSHNDHGVASAGVGSHASHAHDGGYHSHIDHDITKHSSLRSFMLLLALSFHSVFEGIAIGLQDTSGQLVTIFTAVMFHKAVMAFSLGLNIAQSDLSTQTIFMSNIMFSIASPIGVGLGIAVADLPSSLPQDLCSGILQGIAGGTFLYITFFEVLPHELNLPQNRLWKVLFIILGFSCICALLFLAS